MLLSELDCMYVRVFVRAYLSAVCEGGVPKQMLAGKLDLWVCISVIFF